MKSKTKKNQNNKMDSEVQLIPQWYVVSTTTGNEVSVAKGLRAKVKAMNYADLICDVKVIMVQKEESEYYSTKDPKKFPPKIMRNTANIKWISLPGDKIVKKKITMQNKYPGYIFIKMIMTDDAWYVVRNSPNITGLVGSSGSGIKPQPISEEEIENILNDPNILTDSSVINITDDNKIISNNSDDFFDAANVSSEKSENKNDLNLSSNNSLDDSKASFVIIDDKASKITASHASEFYASKKNKFVKNVDEREKQIAMTNVNIIDNNVNAEQIIEDKPIEDQEKKSQFDECESENFVVGNTVQVEINGNKISGLVVEVDLNKKVAKVKIDMLGRETIVDSSFKNIKLDK